ncbi:MAG TPA: hypothetical protein VFV48_08365 [Pseudomonadales bacterium]|nr:hypothetical protein [Pseudomonadales bacterium]
MVSVISDVIIKDKHSASHHTGRAEVCAFLTVLCWTDAFCKVAGAKKGACVQQHGLSTKLEDYPRKAIHSHCHYHPRSSLKASLSYLMQLIVSFGGAAEDKMGLKTNLLMGEF